MGQEASRARLPTSVRLVVQSDHGVVDNHHTLGNRALSEGGNSGDRFAAIVEELKQTAGD